MTDKADDPFGRDKRVFLDRDEPALGSDATDFAELGIQVVRVGEGA